MNTPQAGGETRSAQATLPHLAGRHHRTLEAIFHHPAAHNLEWTDVAALIGAIGELHEKANNEFVFDVAGQRHLMHKPHTKDLTNSEVLEVRHFLTQAKFTPGLPSQPATHPVPAAPSLLIVVDHHGTRIFHVDVSSGDVSQHFIRPYDPHYYLHHLMHKDQAQERGQRAPEEPAYYGRIADAVALGGKIVVVGHGTGKSNAAHHLTEYLQAHHRETYQRIVREITADLSSMTVPQLLERAREALQA